MRAHRRGHGNPHRQVQSLAAPSPSDPLHVCSLTLLQQGASPRMPQCTRRTPVTQFSPSSTQPNSHSLLVTAKDLYYQKNGKKLAPSTPTRTAHPFPKAIPCLRGGELAAHTYTDNSHFPTCSHGFLWFCHPHTPCPFATCSITTLQTLGCLSPYLLGSFTSSSLSTLLSSSFDDNHIRTHARSPKVPSVCSSRNTSIQSPPSPTQAARCKSAEIPNCTCTLTPAVLCYSPACCHTRLQAPVTPNTTGGKHWAG